MRCSAPCTTPERPHSRNQVSNHVCPQADTFNRVACGVTGTCSQLRASCIHRSTFLAQTSHFLAASTTPKHSRRLHDSNLTQLRMPLHPHPPVCCSQQEALWSNETRPSWVIQKRTQLPNQLSRFWAPPPVDRARLWGQQPRLWRENAIQHSQCHTKRACQLLSTSGSSALSQPQCEGCTACYSHLPEVLGLSWSCLLEETSIDVGMTLSASTGHAACCLYMKNGACAITHDARTQMNAARLSSQYRVGFVVTCMARFFSVVCSPECSV